MDRYHEPTIEPGGRRCVALVADDEGNETGCGLLASEHERREPITHGEG